jgi:hypothetical protein
MVFALPPAGQPDVEEVRVAHATGHPGALGGGAYDRNDFEAPFAVDTGAVVYLVGDGPAAPGTTRFAMLGEALAQWSASGKPGQRGYIVVTDNLVDLPDAANPNLALQMPPETDLTVVAAAWRPADVGTEEIIGFILRQSRRLMLLRPLDVESAGAPAAQPGRLTLDGIHADRGVSVKAGALAALDIRHATLLPADGLALALEGDPVLPLAVTLFRCMSGQMVADQNVGALGLKDCLVARVAGQPCIDAAATDVALDRVTLFGGLKARTLNASNSILMETAHAERRQQGCVRYSYLDGDLGQLPRRYRCQPELALAARADQLQRALTAAEAEAVRLAVQPGFIDTEPEQPAYAQLPLDAPDAILSGGEGETEMGGWAFLGGAARLANLADLVADYLPLGLEAGLLRADLSSAEALRRNVP